MGFMNEEEKEFGRSVFENGGEPRLPNQNEIFSKRFGGGKRTYYVDVKQDTNGEKYVVISEASWKDGSDKKFRSRVMIWKEDFNDLFQSIREIEQYLHDQDAL